MIKLNLSELESVRRIKRKRVFTNFFIFGVTYILKIFKMLVTDLFIRTWTIKHGMDVYIHVSDIF